MSSTELGKIGLIIFPRFKKLLKNKEKELESEREYVIVLS